MCKYPSEFVEVWNKIGAVAVDQTTECQTVLPAIEDTGLEKGKVENGYRENSSNGEIIEREKALQRMKRKR